MISLEIIFWGFEKTDAILGNFISKQLNPVLKIIGITINGKIPGVGLVTLLVLITITGVFARNYLGRKLINFGEKILNRIPVLNTVYNLTKQITEGFAVTQTGQGAFRKVVMIEYPRPGIYSPGFLTGEAIEEASERTTQKLLSVFVPTVPNPTTGFLVFVPEENVIILDMSVEDGFKMLLSAGMVKPLKANGNKSVHASSVD